MQHKKDKCNIMFSTIHLYTPKQTAYRDLTGQFPYKYSMGNQYIYLMSNYDSNAILVQAIPNKQAKIIAQVWEKLTEQMTMNGHKYNNFILDNEFLRN